MTLLGTRQYEVLWKVSVRDHSVYVPSQWETALQYNGMSHWLIAYAESSLHWRIYFAFITISFIQVNLWSAELCWETIKIYIFIYIKWKYLHFLSFSEHWDGTYSWNTSPWKSRTWLSYSQPHGCWCQGISNHDTDLLLEYQDNTLVETVNCNW